MDLIHPRLLPQVLLTTMAGTQTSIRADLIIGSTQHDARRTEVQFFTGHGVIEKIEVQDTPQKIREDIWEAVERAK